MFLRFGALLLFLLHSILSYVLYRDSTTYLIISLAWSSIIASIYYLILKTGKISYFRRVFFITLSFGILFALHLKGDYEASFLPHCHITLGSNFLSVSYNQFLSIFNSSWFKFGALSLGALWILIILVNGQGFCSWICFFGGIDDTLSRVLKKPLINLPNTKKFREFQLSFLVFLLIVSFAYIEPIFCKWICPLKITDGILNPNDKAFIIQTIIYISVGVIFLFLAPLLTKKRFFCSTICPFGAIPPLIDKIVPYKVTINQEKCSSCNKCAQVCPSFAIESEKGRYKTNQYCTLCSTCTASCPEGAIKNTIFNKKESLLLPFMSLLFSGALSIFYIPYGVYFLFKLLEDFIL